MQLDRTEIVIRQRNALELFDLSLLVLKRHGRQIMFACALLGIPLLVLDVWAVAWMMSEDSLLAAEHLPAPQAAMRWRYMSHLILLFVMQFPLISLPATILLGNQIFYEALPPGKLIQRLQPIALSSLLILGLVRLGLVGLGLELLVNRNVPFDPGVEIWILFVVTAVGLLLRAGWPFAPEILGLELCPLRGGRAGEITYSQRSQGLHRQLMAEHITRFGAAVVFGSLLLAMLLGGCLFLQGVLLGDWQWNLWFDYLVLPLCLWLVGLYLSVLRFLNYLDSRIRLEGWEIELRLRAEAERLALAARPPLTPNQVVEQAAT